MTDNLSKITRIGLLAFFGISLFFIIGFYLVQPDLETINMNPDKAGNTEYTDIQNIIDQGTVDESSSTDSDIVDKVGAINFLGYYFQWSYVLFFIAAVGAIGFAIFLIVMKFIDEPKKAVFMLVPFLIVGVLILISYAMASDTNLVMPTYDGPDNVPFWLKWSGAEIILTYLLVGLAALSIIYVEVSKIFK